MKVKIQVIIEHDDDTTEMVTEEVGCLQRGAPSLETMGLSMAEGKAILVGIQAQMVTQQVEQHIRQHQRCRQCDQQLRRNGRQRVTFRTLFGTLKLTG